MKFYLKLLFIGSVLPIVLMSGCIQKDISGLFNNGPFAFSIYISNQDEYNDPIHIQVYIDREPKIDVHFFNEAGGIKDHNWTLFKFELEKGSHLITAEIPELNMTLEKDLNMKENSFAILDYYPPNATYPGLRYDFLGPDAPAFM